MHFPISYTGLWAEPTSVCILLLPFQRELRYLAVRMLVIGVALIASSAKECFAEVPQKHVVDLRNCGLFCLYAAFQWYADCPGADSLMRPDYLTAPNGSTMRDLVRAAEDHGYYAQSLRNLHISSLKRSPYPIICSVRKTLSRPAFDHYVIVLPTKNERVAYDVVNNKLLTLDELSKGYWAGNGLLITRKPTCLWVVFLHDYLLLGVGLALLLGLRRLIARHRKTRQPPQYCVVFRALSHGFLLCFISVIGAGLFCLCNCSSSLLLFPKEVSLVQDRHLGTLLHSYDFDKVLHAMQTGAIIIDARLDHDYQTEHIGGAINISPFSPESVYKAALNNLSANRLVILYCQSPGCPYAMEVAAKLRQMGYKNLAYYRGGWTDWQKKRNTA